MARGKERLRHNDIFVFIYLAVITLFIVIFLVSSCYTEKMRWKNEALRSYEALKFGVEYGLYDSREEIKMRTAIRNGRYSLADINVSEKELTELRKKSVEISTKKRSKSHFPGDSGKIPGGH